MHGHVWYRWFNELQLQWNTAYSNQNQTNTPQGNNAEGLELNAFRQKANYFGNPDPVVIASVLDWDLFQVNERFAPVAGL